MTADALIADLRSQDIRLSARAGKLAVDAPKGALTPDVVAMLRANKAALLAVLALTPTGCAWREDDRGRLIFTDGTIYSRTAAGGLILTKHRNRSMIRPGTFALAEATP